MKMTIDNISEKKGVPEGIWTKCKKCDYILLQKDFEENLMVCPKCGYCTRLSARKRIEFTVDKGSFKEMDEAIQPVNFLCFPGYSDKIKKSEMSDAVVTGEAKINGYSVVIAVMDFEFMGGSMGSVVGEKIVRAIEKALKKKRHVIIISASGGARMQEGTISLMQMGKTSAALAKLADNRLAFISILTDPTTGGVAASYAMLGDINIAEPKALIGFAGPRVIEQTIRQQLSEEFQRSEFLEKHGMVDIVVERKNIRDVLTKALTFFYNR
ncbi:acetyl-coenzyme A carboxylase carboxyl transferase subunit beta [Endomicrobiia bacterium]|nr:acetyl-coenzyme A carboxylase carboxyl transferase subunit beta [Endomicrobiia bacterium]GHT11340.1 acetyl-coenzyme A carboxylase carboxyl transferase subunit beta [Endomicrobiia bacterium]GHT20456.1 acetyl-coenzyme A carboxylase carboxyl transferase subunit beta [Endomicrobiia bacterium]GHT27381.1 acetyl-coenzyme A carboxylase carboxyl transferase subunit beta [Endomicrobiia bacterium]GHT29279.1 acetyl-coenzyme A carboxylase carboxyl transferase subunit beta [Endomicrobiia bacterium]